MEAAAALKHEERLQGGILRALVGRRKSAYELARHPEIIRENLGLKITW